MECRLCYNIDYKLVFVFDRVVFWQYENKRRDQPYSIVLLLYLLWPSPDNNIKCCIVCHIISVLCNLINIMLRPYNPVLINMTLEANKSYRPL